MVLPETRIRLLTWNCAGDLSKCTPAVLATRPDIAVLTEVPAMPKGTLGDISHEWIGAPGSRHGLAVVGFNGWRVRQVPEMQPEERLFLPVQIVKADSMMNVAGACVKRAGNYVRPTLSALARLEPFLKSAPSILAGDFNQSRSFDARRPAGGKFQSVIDRLSDLGMRSAWHTFSGDEFGVESMPTLYMRWHEQARFHVDYVFASNRIRVMAATIGSYADFTNTGMSDHLPLVTELAI